MVIFKYLLFYYVNVNLWEKPHVHIDLKKKNHNKKNRCCIMVLQCSCPPIYFKKMFILANLNFIIFEHGVNRFLKKYKLHVNVLHSCLNRLTFNICTQCYAYTHKKILVLRFLTPGSFLNGFNRVIFFFNWLNTSNTVMCFRFF